MRVAPLRPGSYFLSGNAACAEAAIHAGCRFFAAYPITPASDIGERLARRFAGTEDGIFIQCEDELASMAMVLGASAAGAKSMTATSGPGFSLMMENIGLGIMMELPCVVVDVQRGGPSTGLPTLPSQGDVLQARWGTHGDYPMVVLTPESAQEMFHCTLRAFNLAERLRMPVLILSEESVGHTNEPVSVPDAHAIETVSRKMTTVPPLAYRSYEPDDHGVPAMAPLGKGYGVTLTGLSHDERGAPRASDPENHQKLVERLFAKVEAHCPQILLYEEELTEDAELVVIAYGAVGRPAKAAVLQARQQGLKVGLFRPISLFPVPEARLLELARRVRGFVVAEMNAGQFAREVERCVRPVPVRSLSSLAAVHKPEEILHVIEGWAHVD